ncbi:TPM domain-containing protein [Niallia sp. Sow4_A1]|uniref:TPM domain-containing protein n=1 Tax=Niallia hominis TaxID=3133173 RepID=A0ABV1F127_9BACI|nr:MULTISPECIES: TPM domain-containing protein [Bacillaceae]MCM3364418.1 TPM domain-containing protein [Niallia sp. MER TA 168]
MRSKRIFSILMLLFTIFLFAGKSFAEMPQIPDPIGDIYVQDFAGVLTEQEKIEVGRIGSNVEEKTTAQISVLTVESIGDQSIEEFANEVFRQYKIGNEEEDNGILMVIGMNPSSGSDERPLRIEVGYGLEGRLPDGKVGRILDEITIPYLQKNEINRAIIETYKVLASEVLAEYVIEGEKQQVEQPTQELREDEGIGIPSWLLIIIVVVVLYLDFKFFGGVLTHILLSILSRGGRGGGDGPRGGGGGSSGGGGASRGW